MRSLRSGPLFVTRDSSIYFLLPSDTDTLQEDVVALAEGFRDLGIPYTASRDYWYESATTSKPLITKSGDTPPPDCDLVIVGFQWPYQIRMGDWKVVRRALPEWLFARERRYLTVYMDNHDGHRTVSWEPEFRKFDLILRTKLNSRAWYPDNVRAWAYGLNGRVVTATANPIAFHARRRTVLVNYGASHPFPHGAREAWRRRLQPALPPQFAIDPTRDNLSLAPTDPYDELMWRQTDYRFSREYYERLKTSQVVACFCGEIIPGLPFRNPECYLVGGKRARLRRGLYSGLSAALRRVDRIVQWDSFRFWEALAAGCIAINVDLERYGAMLPVMPKSLEHYIGVDLSNPKRTLNVLEDESAIQQIAANGRAWAIENYSPAAAARRLLSYVGAIRPN
jgi:hypothetical protein